MQQSKQSNADDQIMPLKDLPSSKAVNGSLSGFTIAAAVLSLLLVGDFAFGALNGYLEQPSSTQTSEQPTATNAAEEAAPDALKTLKQVKISGFCIFGVDDIKLRPSASRAKGEERRKTSNENGDCWIDKPGQMA